MVLWLVSAIFDYWFAPSIKSFEIRLVKSYLSFKFQFVKFALFHASVRRNMICAFLNILISGIFEVLFGCIISVSLDKMISYSYLYWRFFSSHKFIHLHSLCFFITFDSNTNSKTQLSSLTDQLTLDQHIVAFRTLALVVLEIILEVAVTWAYSTDWILPLNHVISVSDLHALCYFSWWLKPW